MKYSSTPTQKYDLLIQSYAWVWVLHIFQNHALIIIIMAWVCFWKIKNLILKFFQKRSCHDNNYECMLFADMKHSHPHITFYWEVILFSWGGRILCKVKSLIMILLSSYLASFSPPSSGGTTMLLCSYIKETCNNNLGIIFF